MSLILEFPSLKREKDARKYIVEFKEYGSEINGTGAMDDFDNYSEWIRTVEEEHNDINVPTDKVPRSTYFLVREEDNLIVGMVNIRHRLNEFLIQHGYGHIGYSVRPTERRKGYATLILKLALNECKKMGIKKVHVGCYKDNPASWRTIEKNGGVLLREFTEEDLLTSYEYVISLD